MCFEGICDFFLLRYPFFGKVGYTCTRQLFSSLQTARKLP